ncbi:TBC1 domain family member 10B [Archocentrus centrarchus]|uniref:TBC1 domain family member 10B n=1 Tax=Archocentrus centrarchus TaxID=63155 RepID=UPI0011E9D250|nr:TBC1 domain family member 10B-like [Archocentrus centrarchus]
MKRRSSTNAARRSSSVKRRSENLRFDEFGFAVTKKKDQKLYHRCHNYSYPQLSAVRVKELCELLSYWNAASFICKSQIERFIRMSIPPSLRGRVWKCLLTIDSLRETSDFNYQTCLSEVRGPLVDLGVSEYGILSAITTLSDTQNDLGLNRRESTSSSEPRYSADDITLFRQIALDLQRSFPTHRSLMGESPEAIEGQAKLFRVLIAYAKYNPQVGYTQGMSYIAAVLLMELGEEEAFWALVALLDTPKYLAEMFDFSLTKVQHQVKVFDQFLKHRKPQLSQHMESVGVLSVHFVMPWFLTLFTSLPCWDSVLAVWDLIVLHGLSALFRTALTIVELLEPRLMDLKDEGAILSLLLRVPVDVAQYTVLVPALWNTEVQDWELKCMNSLVLDESHNGPKAEQCENQATLSGSVTEGKEEENVSTASVGGKTSEKVSLPGAVSILTRVMRLAQRHLLDSMGRQRVEEKSSQAQAGPRQQGGTSASLTQAQIRSRRQSKQRGGSQQPVVPESGDDVTVRDTEGCEKTEGSEQTFKRSGTGPVGKVAHGRNHHGIVHNVRVKSFHLLRRVKSPVKQAPPSSSSSGPPSSIRSATLPSSPSPSSTPQPSSAPQSGEQNDSPRTALIKELSSRQNSFPFKVVKESKLI